MIPFKYFALGSTLAALANWEVTLSTEPPPHVLEGGRIPFLGPIRRRTLGQTVQRNGSVDVPIRVDTMRLSKLNTLITTYWTNYTTASVALFATWMGEDGNYYPYAVNLERPYEGEHYRVMDAVNVRELVIPAYDWVLQTNTENSTTSITTSERYNESDTTGGAVTLTLPAASAVNPYTLFSFKKTAGGNALSVARAGSDTIDGTTSITVTTRKDVYSDGVSAWTSF